MPPRKGRGFTAGSTTGRLTVCGRGCARASKRAEHFAGSVRDDVGDEVVVAGGARVRGWMLGDGVGGIPGRRITRRLRDARRARWMTTAFLSS